MEPKPTADHDPVGPSWTVQVAKPEFLRDEPISLNLSFENDDQARDFPLEPNVLDVLNFELFDAAGQLLEQANGYTWARRRGSNSAPRDAGKLLREQLPAGDCVEWTEDLLSYVGVLEPGQYGVRANLRYMPAGLDLWSERIDFRVDAPSVRHVDLVSDCVALPIVHSVQLHHNDQDKVGGLVHLRLASALDVHWEGQVFPGDPRLDWLGAVTDFTSFDSFGHDFSRWWAAIEGSAIQLVKVRSDDEPLGASVETGLRAPRQLARPIQHLDGGCTLTLWTADKPGCAVHQLRVGPDGALAQSLGVVASLDGGSPTASALARDGSLVIVMAHADTSAESLVRLSGSKLVSRPLSHPLEGASAAPCSIRLDTRRLNPAGDRLHITGLVETPEGPQLWAAWADIDAEPLHWNHVIVAQHELPLAAEDSIVWADALLDRTGKLHVLARARTGRCVHWSAGSSWLVTDDPAHLPGMPALVACGGHLHMVDARPNSGLLFQRLIELR